MENNFRTVEINPFRVLKEDLYVLQGLPIGIDVQTDEMIKKTVERQERGRIWGGLLIVISLFFLVGFSCAGCDGENNSLWVVMAIPVLLYMLLQRSVSSNELTEIISKRSRDLLTQEITRTKEHLTSTPFVVRRANNLYENLPQVTFLDNIIERCKRESQFFSQKLLQFKSHLVDSLPSGIKLEEALERPEIQRLYIRVQLYKELMDSFESTFALMLVERDLLHKARKNIRAIAKQDTLRTNPPAPHLQIYPLQKGLNLDQEKKASIETAFAETIRLSKTIDQRWRLILENISDPESTTTFEDLTTSNNPAENLQQQPQAEPNPSPNAEQSPETNKV